MKPTIWFLTLLALLSAPHLASAFYDPGVQRWINRDPIAESGGFNLYCFLRNEPTAHLDSFGYRSKRTPPPGFDYDPNCYAKCGKQNLIELGLCTGLSAGTVAFCVWQPQLCVPYLDKIAAAIVACYTAAEVHYTACLGSCLITRKCPYPFGPYPNGPFDFP